MCFSALWFVEFLVLAIVVVCALKIGRVVLNLILEWLGDLGKYAAAVVDIIRIVIIGLILIWLVWFAYDTIMCVLGHGGSMPPMPRIGR